MIARDWERMIAALSAYAAGSRGYRSRIATFRQGEIREYDHLARVREWSLGGAEEEDGQEEGGEA